jgi:anti-sigma factor RsiW
MSSMPDDRFLIHAALDGELDAAEMLGLEQKLTQDPELAAEYKRLRALRGLVDRHIGKPVAPEALRVRMAALAQRPAPEPVSLPRRRPFAGTPWRAMAASALIAAGLASGTTWLALEPRLNSSGLNSERIGEMLVADHMRGLLSGQPVDVASSDRHTVKPWFNSRLALAPQVVDLGAAGFPLIGGRVDVMNGVPIPTLVYRRNAHLISVTALPAKNSSVPAFPERIEGYSVLAWRDDRSNYWAVSDVDLSELQIFGKLFQSAVEAGSQPAPEHRDDAPPSAR